MAVSFEETAQAFALSTNRQSVVDSLVPGTLEYSFFSALLLLQGVAPLNREDFERKIAAANAQHPAEGILPLLKSLRHRFYLQLYDQDGLTRDVVQYLVKELQLDHEWRQISPELQEALVGNLHSTAAGVAEIDLGYVRR